MPDRILRQGIIDSKKVNSLSWAAEVCYRRLHSLADDYGLYYAEAAMLRANLYPRQLSKVSESDITKWMKEISEAGLVSFYDHDGSLYLEIVKFNQRLRQKRMKFPVPPSFKNSEQSACGSHAERPPETKRNEIESESEIEEREKRRQMPTSRSRDDVFKILKQFLTRSQGKYYGKELQKAIEASKRYLADNNITEQVMASDESIRKKFDEADEKIWNKFIGIHMRQDIDDCYSYYEARNFKIDGEPIHQWQSVMKGWMRNKPRTAKQK